MIGIVVFLSAACGGSQSISIGGGGGDSGVPGNDSGADTDADPLPGETDTGEAEDTAPEEDPEAEAAWQDAFFVDTVIHDIEITLSDDAYRDIRRDGHTFVPGDVTVDGETTTGVGVRLRGKIGSYREISGKPKFKIDMSEFVKGQRFHGLHSLALNNEVVDCSYLREPIAYRAFRDMGIPASRASFSRVTVNGEAYGLYVIVEVPDHELLSHHFPEEDDGNLYDGKYVYNWANGSYVLLDFQSNVDDQYPLEEGVDVDNADIKAISAAMDAAPYGPGFEAALDPLMDWGEWQTAWAVEQWVGHLDGYQMNKNNYRVYFRPSDGKMIYLPTDFDYGFLSDGGWGVGWTGPIGALSYRCYLDSACLAEHKTAVAAMLDTLDAAALDQQLTDMAALTHDDAANDPRRECATRDVWATQDYMHAWITGREAQVRATWGL